MNVRLKRAKELAGYAVQLTKDEGLPTMVKRGAGFVKRRCFGKRARYLPAKKVLEAQRAEMAGKTAADCGLPTISVLTPLYNTPEKYLREFLDSFVGQTAPNGQLCLADASDAAHGDVERIVKEYQQKNQQIVYKKIENQGIAANTNAAAQLATGEYLALADHDDILAPHALYTMGKAILQLRQRGEPDGFCTATRPCSPRASAAPWWRTSSQTTPRTTCCAATTSAIWRCSKKRCGSSWAANDRNATAVRIMICSCGCWKRPAVPPMCRRCSTTGGCTRGLPPAVQTPSHTLRQQPKRRWQTT